MVTVPYVKGLSEAFNRTQKAHRICMSMKRHTTLRNLLVHLEDKIVDEEKSELVYRTVCMNCDRVYIREMGDHLGHK